MGHSFSEVDPAILIRIIDCLETATDVAIRTTSF